jgi:hypothetical protein
MAWTTFTSDAVLDEFTERERAALDAIKGRSAMDTLCARVVAEFRGAINAGSYALGDDGTLPDALHSHAAAVCRWRFLTSIAKAEALQTDDRKDANKRAEAILDKIAEMKWSVEAPAGTASRSGNWNSDNKLLTRTHPVPRPAAQFPGNSNSYANPDAPADYS